MIEKVVISNYKSIEDMTIELGRFNVIIGENGSGKSNILEAIALLSAAAMRKLDNEYLGRIGIRPSKPRFMRSAFQSDGEKTIKVAANSKNESYVAELSHDGLPYSEWKDVFRERTEKELRNVFEFLATGHENETVHKGLGGDAYTKLLQVRKGVKGATKGDLAAPAFTDFFEMFRKEFDSKPIENLGLKNFMIYKPEESAIRRIETDGQMEPLGVRGEGLIKLLSLMFVRPDEKRMKDLSDSLKLIGWFKDMKLHEGEYRKEIYIDLVDKYIDEAAGLYDQRNSNEGFLFLLFYIILFVSKETPSFFAIENIDTALNPKLCEKLTSVLAELAKKYSKQVILTTHNPSVLDGLDMNDRTVRLFVAYRNGTGRTMIRRVPKPTSGTRRKMSEYFVQGVLGGLPKNF